MTETHEEGETEPQKPTEHISDVQEEHTTYEGTSFSYLDLLKGKIPDASRRSS